MGPTAPGSPLDLRPLHRGEAGNERSSISETGSLHLKTSGATPAWIATVRG
jgi:hypothetical protein